MWVDDRPFAKNWHGGPIEPSEVLYDFDGPAIFTSQIGPATLLFFKVAEYDEGDVFLAAPVDDEELTALRGGHLSIRGSMSHREAWVVEVDFDFVVRRYQEQSYREYEPLLPQNGVALYAKYGEVPDTIEQAEAFLSFKFESDLMTSLSMPLSVLKGRIDAVSEVVRDALLPERLAFGRKARFFDVDVAPLRFNSLLIAIKDPQIDELGLLTSKETAGFTAESLITDSEDRGAHFLAELDAAAALARKDTLTRDQADLHFELLDSIVGIIPTTKNDITRLQVGFRTDNGTKLVSIDKRTGDRLLAARKSIEAPIRDIVGAIIELNDDARTFIMKDAGGRQTTINPLFDRYQDMEERKLLRIGQRLKVTGKLWERTRRDYMILTKDVIQLTYGDADEEE